MLTLRERLRVSSGSGPLWLREPGTESVFVDAPRAVHCERFATAPAPGAWERGHFSCSGSGLVSNGPVPRRLREPGGESIFVDAP